MSVAKREEVSKRAARERAPREHICLSAFRSRPLSSDSPELKYDGVAGFFKRGCHEKSINI